MTSHPNKDVHPSDHDETITDPVEAFVRLPLPTFADPEGTQRGLSLGGVAVVEFPYVLRSVDTTGAIRRAITAGLNDAPGLRETILRKIVNPRADIAVAPADA
jgi:hypothetical protein